MAKEYTSFQYTRQWFDFCFEHQGEVNTNDTALYLWLVELKNRMGWVENFGCPASQCMAAMGVGSYNTYKKSFDKLVKLGFVKVIKPSINQYQASIIALSIFDKALAKALDKSLMMHLQKQSESTCKSTVESTCDIIKPINQETNKQVNKETKEDLFAIFWDLYDKKTDTAKCKAKFLQLSNKDIETILSTVASYVKAHPDKQFRKNPLTYLNGQCWKDEIQFLKPAQITPAAPLPYNHPDNKDFFRGFQTNH